MLPSRDEIPGYTFSHFLTAFQWSVGMSHYRLVRVEAETFYLVFDGRGAVGEAVFSVVFCWNSFYSKVFCLVRLSLSCPVPRDCRPFSGAFCVSAPIGIFGSLVFPVCGLGCMRPKENAVSSPLCHSSGPVVSSWSSSFSPSFSLFMFISYTMSRVFIFT